MSNVTSSATILVMPKIRPRFFPILVVGLFGLTIFPDYAFSNENQVRVATFNTSLFGKKTGELKQELGSGQSRQARNVAAIIQRVRPDILLLNEFDFERDQQNVRLFERLYLGHSQEDGQPIKYPYTFVAPVNTGIASGFDLDGDQKKDGAGDAFGYGNFPGQYGMAVLSKFPINRQMTRTFQKFLWKDMPKALTPTNKDNTGFYSQEAWKQFRLSSKSHWDVVIELRQQQLHFLVSHPTPPVFDKEDDHNGRRNHDEIRFWKDYIQPQTSVYIYDDQGGVGGLKKNSLFIIAGDQNADPADGDSTGSPIRMLLQHASIQAEPAPGSAGAVEASRFGKANLKHRGKPKLDTAQFGPETVGNLRLDYVLPSKNLRLVDSGVFWPLKNEPEARFIQASDHRLVWIDIQLPSMKR